jgi:hypothetical protein
MNAAVPHDVWMPQPQRTYAMLQTERQASRYVSSLHDMRRLSMAERRQDAS